MNLHFLRLTSIKCQLTANNLKYTAIVIGCPKKWLIECCCNHSAQAKSPVAGTPCVWIFFWSFLTKTKQDQVLPSHVHGKIWPHHSILIRIFYICQFFGPPCVFTWPQNVAVTKDWWSKFSRNDNSNNVAWHLTRAYGRSVSSTTKKLSLMEINNRL